VLNAFSRDVYGICICFQQSDVAAHLHSCVLVIGVADNTASWSSNTVIQYITSLTQNAAVKPGTIFISRPLVSATEEGGKSALFTNGTALTVTSDLDTVAVSNDDPLQVISH